MNDNDPLEAFQIFDWAFWLSNNLSTKTRSSVSGEAFYPASDRIWEPKTAGDMPLANQVAKLFDTISDGAKTRFKRGLLHAAKHLLEQQESEALRTVLTVAELIKFPVLDVHLSPEPLQGYSRKLQEILSAVTRVDRGPKA